LKFDKEALIERLLALRNLIKDGSIKEKNLLYLDIIISGIEKGNYNLEQKAQKEIPPIDKTFEFEWRFVDDPSI